MNEAKITITTFAEVVTVMLIQESILVTQISLCFPVTSRLVLPVGQSLEYRMH